MPPKVIGAGHGRTGTNSTRQALAKLYGVQKEKIYHMDTILHEGQIQDAATWAAMLEAKGRGDKETVKALAKPMCDKYEALIDYPPSVFYQELMELYPDAKCVLTTREADAWYESVLVTLWAVRKASQGTWMSVLDSWTIKFYKMIDPLLWEGPNCLWPNFLDKAATLARFNKWNEDVLKSLPKDRVLAWSVKEGYKPLCAFLGVEAPDEPFPRVNEAQVFTDAIKIIGRVDFVGKFIVFPSIAAALGFGIFKAVQVFKA